MTKSVLRTNRSTPNINPRLSSLHASAIAIIGKEKAMTQELERQGPCDYQPNSTSHASCMARTPEAAS